MSSTGKSPFEFNQHLLGWEGVVLSATPWTPGSDVVSLAVHCLGIIMYLRFTVG